MPIAPGPLTPTVPRHNTADQTAAASRLVQTALHDRLATIDPESLGTSQLGHALHLSCARARLYTQARRGGSGPIGSFHGPVVLCAGWAAAAVVIVVSPGRRWRTEGEELVLMGVQVGVLGFGNLVRGIGNRVARRSRQ